MLSSHMKLIRKIKRMLISRESWRTIEPISAFEGVESLVVCSLEVVAWLCFFESNNRRVPAGSDLCMLVNSSSCTPRLAESLEVEETDTSSGPLASASGIPSESWVDSWVELA
jgi:hypothetical protein